ncbi:sulfotransferase family 2 domain-containing protein [Celeribacter sp.]|uniref:sulfotransferase family 2 domain-containing protein n=1 Tax=Celeribacter sp. TaxID=1890673 RepID=UPI003A91BFD3
MRLSPELRTRLIEGYTAHAPVALKRFTSAQVGLPIRPEVRRAGVIFIHVPKNAGTTIAKQLYGRHIGHRTARFYRDADPTFFQKTPSFALLRDPVERFVSAYDFAARGGSPSVPASAQVTEFVRTCGSMALCAERILHMDESARARLDFVLRRQSDFICDAQGEIMVDHLFRLDDVAGREFQVGGHVITMKQRENAATQDKQSADAHLVELLAQVYPRDFALWANAGEVAP